MRRSLLVFAAVAVVIAVVHSPTRAADGDPWGEPVAGLRLRADAPPTPIGGSPLLAMLEIELRNDTKKHVLLTRLGVRARLTTADGKPLPDGVVELPVVAPVGRADTKLAPGASLRWYPRLLRTRDDAPTKLRLRAEIPARDAEGRGPYPLRSRPFEVDLTGRPAARALTRDDLAAGWSGASVLVYRENMGIYGWHQLEVWPDGTATVYRSVNGPVDEKLPAGRYRAPLTAAEQTKLAATLLERRAWTLGEIPTETTSPRPSHGGEVTAIVISGEAALVARFWMREGVEHPGYPELKAALRALMERVAARATKGPR